MSNSNAKIIRYVSRAARYVLLTGSILTIAVIAFLLFTTLRPEDSLGEADENCIETDLPSVPNGAGKEVTAHVTSCGYFIAYGDDTTYFYLHRAGEKDASRSLVFRYDNIHGAQPTPQIVWSDRSTVHISVSQVGEVTKQVPSTDGVKILYSVGLEDAPAGSSATLVRCTAAALFVLLYFLVKACVLTLRSLRKEKATAT